ncbi:hypothetical protein [Pectobacterium polaris]|uniref:hypothetical protein n=1 Tax=Pectobacterium polaris TaxID=2042057 RepID=UPI001968F893|nr:hypothetical protein [Pectobacterium polaris]MBN3218162.1 hypothetical protein [Pectobacterium polaris]
MKKLLILGLLFSTSAFSAYKTYDPHKDSKLVTKAISGVCKSEHQKYDGLDYQLKSNVGSMSDSDAKYAVANLKGAKRKRWECIEKELNKKNITLNLEQLFKEDNL